MTKRDLIEEVAEPRFSRREAEVMVNAVFDTMTYALVKGQRIEIRGFGSFIIKYRPAREGRNPRTGTVVSVAAKRVPLFKVGKELRLRVDSRIDQTNSADSAGPDGTDGNGQTNMPARLRRGASAEGAEER